MGLSQATISRVINKSSLVKRSTREEILGAVRKLGYEPNHSARALRAGKTHTLGLILPNFYFLEGRNTARVVEGIAQTAGKHGYELTISALPSYELVDKKLRQYVREERLDGVFTISGSVRLEAELGSFIRTSVVPIVFVNSNLAEPELYSVGSDHRGGVYAATRHLLGKGYERIVFLGDCPTARIAQERVEGYRKALEEAGRPFVRIVSFEGDYDDLPDWGYRMMRDMAKAADVPDAIVAYNDDVAFGVMKAAHEAGINIPKDVGLVGFGNSANASYSIPPLTTVREKGFIVGSQAMETMVSLLKGGKPKKKLHVATELVIRESA